MDGVVEVVGVKVGRVIVKFLNADVVSNGVEGRLGISAKVIVVEDEDV